MKEKNLVVYPGRYDQLFEDLISRGYDTDRAVREARTQSNWEAGMDDAMSIGMTIYKSDDPMMDRNRQ